MHNLVVFIKKLQVFYEFAAIKLCSFTKSSWDSIKCSFWFLYQINPFFIQLLYFTLISFVGFVSLKILKPRNEVNTPKDLDLFFTSVSASTVSSMATVEMEDFSSSQLWVLTILMLVGGEVFTSMLDLHLIKAKLGKEGSESTRVNSFYVDVESMNSTNVDSHMVMMGNQVNATSSEHQSGDKEFLKLEAIKSLGYVVTGYLLAAILSGSLLILLYVSLASDARDVLQRKGIGVSIFSVFTAVSSVANCGFIPANENMIIFQKNSILLLIIIPQILAGNTLYAPFLRFLIWSLKKITGKKEYDYILQHPDATQYKHLLPHIQCSYLTSTVLGFIFVQTILICSLEWNSEALQEMNSYQKIVGGLFQSVNSRHAGESIFDLSTLSPAILVLCTIMMYFPAYTSFFPKDDDCQPATIVNKDNRKKLYEKWIFSQLSYIAVFIILICITERNAMAMDPLNFNVFNILFEVISAYGNVGFSVGYSCKRLLQHDTYCKDASYGFAGKWSTKGKLILIIVMILGRLKAFNMSGGKAWKLR